MWCRVNVVRSVCRVLGDISRCGERPRAMHGGRWMVQGRDRKVRV